MEKAREGKTKTQARKLVPRVLRYRRVQRGVKGNRPNSVPQVRGYGRSRRGVNRPKHASFYEDRVIADLEKRNVAYLYEPETFNFRRKIVGAKCSHCASREVYRESRYTPDIRLGDRETGHCMFIECKGKLTADTRGRMEDFLADPRNSGIDLRFLFQRDNWITKNHKSRYSDWAGSQGIRYSVGDSVPQEWIDEIKSVDSSGSS